MSCLAGGTPVKSMGVTRLMPETPHENQFQFGHVLDSTGFMNTAVQLARQNNGRNVAIKRYNVDKHLQETGEDAAPYIQHEVASLKMLRHQNIISCVAAFVVEQEIWLVTPLMGYGSVRDLIKNHFNDGLPELVCSFILRDVLVALQYLHLQGIVHRSVRCSHILVHESGHAVLGGFRYCTKLHAIGENRTNLYDYPLHGITSNLCWLAPELLKQNLLGYSETSDLYSLGISACEMANGVVPFSDFPPTLMLVEKLRGSSPRLMDYSTINQANQEEEAPGFQGHPADSGVGDSVGSCNNMMSKNSAYFNREFSPGFHDFIFECTVSDGDERQTARELLHHAFIKQLKKSSANLVTLLYPIQPLSSTDQVADDGGLIVEQMENLRMEDCCDVCDWDFDEK